MQAVKRPLPFLGKAWHNPEFWMLLLLLAVAYISLFHRLGQTHLTLWDEARYANNAIDLLENPHLFKVTHLGEPDEFNTKPALVIWLQAGCMWLFGISELAVRMPSAVFALFTLGLVYFFSRRYFVSPFSGWLAAALLLCSPGYMSSHIARTGDLDAVLVFWLFLGLVVTVDLLVKRPKSTRNHFVLLTLSVFCGFLTKGIAGFFFAPFLLLLPVVSGRTAVFRDKNLYLSGLVLLLLCAGYYFMREYYMPGYLELVTQYEWNRYTEVVMSWQKHPFMWYFDQLALARFYPFFYALPVGILGLFNFKGDKRIAYISLLLTTIGYFLLISYPDVKLVWYDAPLYPLLVLILGLCLGSWAEWLLGFLRVPASGFVLLALGCLLLFQPYRQTLAAMRAEDELIYDLIAEGACLREIRAARPEIKNISIYKVAPHPAHYDQLLFYIRRYNLEEDCQFRLVHAHDFQRNEVILLTQSSDIAAIKSRYQLSLVYEAKAGSLFRVTGKM